MSRDYVNIYTPAAGCALVGSRRSPRLSTTECRVYIANVSTVSDPPGSHVLPTLRRTVFVRDIICCCIQTNRRTVYIHRCRYIASAVRPVPSITGYLCNSHRRRLIQKVQSDPLLPFDNDTVALCVGTPIRCTLGSFTVGYWKMNEQHPRSYELAFRSYCASVNT